MFKLDKLTDFEKLQFTESYIKELKKQLRIQEETANNAVLNLRKFIADVRAISKKGARLMSYKEEMMSAHKKSKKLELLNEKLEHKNYLLREKIRNYETI